MNSLADYKKRDLNNRFCCQCYNSSETDHTAKKSNFFPIIGTEKLFCKVLKQSDIKQYRLAIPKQQAKTYFSTHLDAIASSSSQGVFLCMEDHRGQVWRFKYSYWKSSQGYVLTNEWSQFVKVNSLCPGDVICFLQSTGPDKRLYVDCKKQSKSGIAFDDRSVQSTCRKQIKLFGVEI